MRGLDVPATLGVIVSAIAVIAAVVAVLRAAVSLGAAVQKNTDATEGLSTAFKDAATAQKEAQKETASTFEGIRQWLASHDVTLAEHRVEIDALKETPKRRRVS